MFTAEDNMKFESELARQRDASKMEELHQVITGLEKEKTRM